jgi:hypothetical protein
MIAPLAALEVEVEDEHTGLSPELSPARQLLLQHQEWTLRALEAVVRAMSARNSAPEIGERAMRTSPAAVELDKLNEIGERLETRLRKIRGYLGVKWNSSIPNALDAVREIRARIQMGNNDEELALYLGFYFRGLFPVTHIPAAEVSAPYEYLDTRSLQLLFDFQRSKLNPKHGRQVGSNDCNGLALRALELHESDLKRWTWPKVVDELKDCGCKGLHEWDSPCTKRIQKSARRLQEFLKELETTWSHRQP